MTRKSKGGSGYDQGFFDHVYSVTRLIPPGRVTTYGAIASCIGAPGAARMVGWALNKVDGLPYPVPAHRVVNRTGLLTGKNFFGGSGLMEQLLQSEGVDVKNDRVVNFSSHFWDPASARNGTRST